MKPAKEVGGDLYDFFMVDALNRDPDAAPEVIDRNVHEAIASFVQDAAQFDDTTMLTLKYFGS